MRFFASKRIAFYLALAISLGVVFLLLLVARVHLAISASTLFSLCILIGVHVLLYRRLKARMDWHLQGMKRQLSMDYLQIESLHNIHSVLPLRAPLPQMRGWAISPDFASLLISQILENKPKCIVEASSGVSTLLSAYCLELIGEGCVYSLDHERKYAEITQKNLYTHNLNNWATVVHAPLVEHILDNDKWKWYELVSLKDVQSIDMLIIDGPPITTQKEARYPALPLLIDRLSPAAVILVDDADRVDETSMISKWKNANPYLREFEVKAEKGAVVLMRCPIKE